MNPNLSPKLASVVQEILNFFGLSFVDEAPEPTDLGYEAGDIYNTYAFDLLTPTNKKVFRIVCTEFVANDVIISRCVTNSKQTISQFDSTLAVR